MDLIKNWLSGKRNYVVGVVLYKKFGKDENLKKLFDQPHPDKYRQERLAKELAALLEEPKEQLQPAKAKKPPEADEMPKSDDAVLDAIRNEWMPMYQRMNYLRHELDRYEEHTPEQAATRKTLATEILELEQKCMQCWARRDHYLEHGKLPEVKPVEKPISGNPVQLGIDIETLRRNIRRNRVKAEKDPANPIYPLKIKFYQEELEKILKKISDEKSGKQTGLQPGSD